MKIKGNKVKQGIKIKAVGSTEKERKIMKKAIRKIEYGRKRQLPTSPVFNGTKVNWNSCEQLWTWQQRARLQ